MRWTFNDFVLDVERRELRRSGTPVAVEPQVFDVLVYLISNRARVVSKNDLLEAVWRRRAVSDSALANRMNAVRTAIGDSGNEQTLVRTLPRKGFRFIGVITEDNSQTDPVQSGSALLLASHLPEQPSLVILPFTDSSPDQNEGHFADGITADLTMELARIRWLLVIARNSAFAYTRRPIDVKQVSRELGVRYVLEGSVRRSGHHMRINVQLIDAATGVHQWVERFDRDAGEILTVQDEIANNVAAAVEPHLLAAEGRRAAFLSPTELSTWELVASAQSQLWRLTKLDYDNAIASLLRAVQRSPDFAPAQAFLGFALVFAAHMGWMDKESVPVGRRHAERAIALDDRNPWGYSALGYAATMQRRTDEAIAAFRGAVNLTPSSAAAHAHLSRGLAFAGHSDDAIKHGEAAIRLSPLDPEMPLFRGAIAIAHYAARRFDEFLRFTVDNLRLRPGFQGAQRLHCASLAQAGRVDEAREFLSTVRHSHRPPLTIAWVRENVPFQTMELLELFIDGLRKAGLN